VVVRYGQGGAGVGGLGIAQAKCEPGERATGGGGTEVVSGSHEKVVFYTPGGAPLPPTPGATPTGWSVEWLNTGATEDLVSVYVICASP
jgi:hypothetical protein